MVKVRKEITLGKDLVYIGRVLGCRGYRSAWANPCKIKGRVIALNRLHVQDSEILKEIRRLEGNTVLCHYSFEACHGDALEFIEDGLPSRARGLVNNDELKKGMLGGGWRGRGPMKIAHFLGKDRGTVEGYARQDDGRKTNGPFQLD